MSRVASDEVLARGPSNRREAADLLRAFADGALSDDAFANVLTVLHARGETPGVLAGFVEVLRERMVVVDVDDLDPVDLCGTGGDGQGTLNLSTAAAFVAASAGAFVAKHGNHGVSSRTGSSDVLLALGLSPLPGPGCSREALRRHGLVFLHAPSHHPLVARLAPIRRALRFRTAFNLIGPLCNPARVRRQVVGVPSSEILDTLARVSLEMGTERALILHTPGPYDEVSLTEDTLALRVDAGRILPLRFGPATFGVSPVKARILRGGDAHENAARLERLFTEPHRDMRLAQVVAANAACALWVSDCVSSLREDFESAMEALHEGRAWDRLQALRAFHREVTHGLVG